MPPRPNRPAPGKGQIDQAIDQAYALHTKGRTTDAVDLLRRAVQKAPAHAEGNALLARMLLSTNQPDQATFFAERAVAAAPNDPQIRLMYAQTIGKRSEPERVLAELERVLALAPDEPEALAAKGQVLVNMGFPERAIASMERAVAVAPDRPEFKSNLGTHLLENGRPDEGCALLREAVAADPNEPTFLAALALGLNYSPAATREEIFEVHRRYGRSLELKVTPHRQFPNTPDPDRPIRVGFVSRDLRRHSVAYFLEPILEHHDPQRAHMTCYTTSRARDEVTERLDAKSDLWRDCHAHDHITLMETIRKDRVDVLIDLAGHFAGARMPVFASRPAPVQVTYCGYPNTSGLSRITARFVDSITDPAPDADALATERLVRLDPCFLCYRPFEDAPPPRSAPNPGPFTFGSFNATKKYSPQTLDAWGEILKRAPDSRLYLKHPRFRMEDVRDHFIAEFRARGVDPERVELALKVDDTAGHLAAYDHLDLALDPFPYHGTTTTCEALWMGVPTLTLAGDRHATRVGASLMHAVGLDELVTDSVDHYVELAVALAGDPARMTRLRAGLRERVAGSPLCDGPAFARRFEDALSTLWRAWCADPR